MPLITVLQGRDKQYPSVRVRFNVTEPNREGSFAREIALVFNHEEDVPTMRRLIDEAVWSHLDTISIADVERRIVEDNILGERFAEKPILFEEG